MMEGLLGGDGLAELQHTWRRFDLHYAGARPWGEFFEQFKPTARDLAQEAVGVSAIVRRDTRQGERLRPRLAVAVHIHRVGQVEQHTIGIRQQLASRLLASGSKDSTVKVRAQAQPVRGGPVPSADR